MAGEPKHRTRHGGGSRSSHFHLPGQLILGLLFLASGSLLLLKYFGRDYLAFLPEPILVIICGLGSAIGGFYLIVSKIYKPRLYL